MKIKILILLICSGLVVVSSKLNEGIFNQEKITPQTVGQTYSTDVEKTLEERLSEQMLKSDSLSEAITLIKPMMTDEFVAFPSSAELLAFWMDQKSIKIDSIKHIEASTRANILKNSNRERGKKICLTGRVTSIRADPSIGFEAYHAGIATNYLNPTRVLVVGSIGNLVTNAKGNFCGIVIGKVGFTNAAGGTLIAPFLVGMFDLPDNQ